MSIDAKLFLTVHHQNAIGSISLPKSSRDAGERGTEYYQVEVVLPFAPVAEDVIIDGDATWRRQVPNKLERGRLWLHRRATERMVPT